MLRHQLQNADLYNLVQKQLLFKKEYHLLFKIQTWASIIVSFYVLSKRLRFLSLGYISLLQNQNAFARLKKKETSVFTLPSDTAKQLC